MPVLGSSRPSGGSCIPQYCRQRRKGKPDIGFYRIDGRKVSLGRYGTPESLTRFNELIAKQEEEPPPKPAGSTTVSMVIKQYIAIMIHVQSRIG